MPREAHAQSRDLLVLGATPELRDLAHKCNFHVHVMDFSINMLTTMSDLLRVSNPDKEQWILQNWLETKTYTNRFSTIIGDLVLDQVTPDQEVVLMKQIAHMLAPGGICVLRCCVIDIAATHKTADVIFTQYSDDLLLDANERLNHIKLETSWAYADPDKRLYDRQAARSAFQIFSKEYRGNQQKLLKDLEVVFLDLEKTYRSWCPGTQADLESKFDTVFSADKKVHYAHDYPLASHYPIYTLRKD